MMMGCSGDIIKHIVDTFSRLRDIFMVPLAEMNVPKAQPKMVIDVQCRKDFECMVL